MRHYAEVDYLFFPSKLESYGLPLVEALRGAKIPVIAADREYARELCGNLALYFDPDNEEDAVNKIREIISTGKTRIEDNEILSLPSQSSWEMMAKALVNGGF